MTVRTLTMLAVLAGSIGPVWSQSSTQTTLRNPPAGASHALLVSFGIGATSEIRWNGSLQVENGDLVELIGYEMGIGDIIHPPRRWELATRPAFAFDRRNHDEDILVDLPAGTYLTPRFYVYLSGSDATRVQFETEQGSFEVRVGELPPAGATHFLDGRASVARSRSPCWSGAAIPARPPGD